MQIKHGGCCLSVCRRPWALINLCNFGRHKWGCYRFCVTGWALEHRLIGYGWIIHLNHRIAAWLCGPCQWLSRGMTGQSAGNAAMIGEWKWSVLFLLTFLDQQKCYPCFFFLTSTIDIGFHPALLFSSPAILHNKTFSPCSDICWWIDLCCRGNIAVCHDDACFGGIDHLKPLKLRQFMSAAWQPHISKGLLCTGKSSRQGETVAVSEMKLWLCLFLVMQFSLLKADALIIRSLGMKWQDSLFLLSR